MTCGDFWVQHSGDAVLESLRPPPPARSIMNSSDEGGGGDVDRREERPECIDAQGREWSAVQRHAVTVAASEAARTTRTCSPVLSAERSEGTTFFPISFGGHTHTVRLALYFARVSCVTRKCRTSSRRRRGADGMRVCVEGGERAPGCRYVTSCSRNMFAGIIAGHAAFGHGTHSFSTSTLEMDALQLLHHGSH